MWPDQRCQQHKERKRLKEKKWQGKVPQNTGDRKKQYMKNRSQKQQKSKNGSG